MCSRPVGLLFLFCSAAFLTMLSVLMLGPLLVALAHEFQTSVVIMGQLAAATAITWAITAPLAGPVADAYGRRLILLIGLLLMTVGLLGAVLAWNYSALLACRLLTGVGAAVVPPNSIAMLSEVFPPTRRGKAVGWLLSATGVSAAVGVPLVAYLLGAGGWRLPFAVIGMAALVVGILLWVWCPRHQRQPGQTLAFFAHYREAGAHVMFWYMLAVNALQQIVFFGMFAYLATYLIQSYQMQAEATALPLALVGGGVIVGSVLGGRIADRRRRLAWFALSCWGSGLLAVLIFTVQISPWATVALAFGVTCLTRISNVVTPILLLEQAGSSRTTATGLFTLSSQLGVGWPVIRGTDASAGRVREAGSFLSRGVGPRRRGASIQGTRLGGLPGTDGATEGRHGHRIRCRTITCARLWPCDIYSPEAIALASLQGRFVEGEALLRQDRATGRCIRLTRFPVLKTLDPFRWDWPTQINQAHQKHSFVRRFQTLQTHPGRQYRKGTEDKRMP